MFSKPLLRFGWRALPALLAVLVCAPGASAANYVLEDWNGAAPVGTWKSNASLDFKGWNSAISDTRTFETSQSPTFWEGRGLYAKSGLSVLAGTGTAEWRWQAPGTATIYRAEYAPSTFNLLGCLNEGLRTSAGAWQPTINGRPGQQTGNSYHPTACGVGVLVPPLASAQVIIGNPGAQIFCSNVATPCDRNGSPVGNQAVFGIQRMGLAQPWFAAYLPGAKIFETDYDKPTFSGATNDRTKWVRQAIGTIVPTASDTGLGVKTIALTNPARTGGTATQTKSSACTGDRNSRCHATWNTDAPKYAPSYTYDTDDLPEGVVPFGLKATDIVENQSLPATGPDTSLVTPAKVDRSVPTDINGTGPVPDLDGRWFLGNDTRTITASAHDTYSGVQTIQVETTSGQILDKYTFDCSGDQCPRDITRTLAVDTTKLPEGDTVVRLRATDLVGNTSVGRTWTLRIDRSNPTDVNGSGNLPEIDGVWTVGNDVRTVDATANDRYSGVKRLALETVGGTVFDSRTFTCTPQGCATSNAAPISVDLNALPEGETRVRVRATDLLDHESTSRTWTLRIDRSNPAVDGVAGPLVDGDGGYTAGNGPIPVTVATHDLRSPDGQPLSGIERVIVREAGGQTVADRTLACGAGCPEAPSVDLNADLSGLGEGTHTFEAVVTDRVGHETVSSQWTLTIDRSAPVLVSDVVATAYDDSALISWGAVDQELPGGTPGVGLTGEAIRFQEADGSWSPWASVNGAFETERSGHLTIQFQFSDRLDNRVDTAPQGIDVENPDISDDEEDALDPDVNDCEAIYDPEDCGTEDSGRSALAGRSAIAGRSAARASQSADWGIADSDAAWQRGLVDHSFLDSDIISDLGKPNHLRLLVAWNVMDPKYHLTNRREALIEELKLAEHKRIPVMISFEAGCSTDSDQGAKSGKAAFACSGNAAMLKSKVPPKGAVNNAARLILTSVPKDVGRNVQWFSVWNEPQNEHQPFDPDKDRPGKEHKGEGQKRLQRLTREMTKPRTGKKETWGVCARFTWCDIVSAEVELMDSSFKNQDAYPMTYATFLKKLSETTDNVVDYYGAHGYSEVLRSGQKAGAKASGSTLVSWMKKLPEDAAVWLPEIGAMAESNNLKGEPNGRKPTEPNGLENEADYLFKEYSRVSTSSNGAYVAMASYYHVCPAPEAGFDTGLFEDRPFRSGSDCTTGASRRSHVFNLLRSAFRESNG